MKRIITVAAIAVTLALLLSCKKDKCIEPEKKEMCMGCSPNKRPVVDSTKVVKF